MNVINFIRELVHQSYFGCFLSIVTCLGFYFFKSRPSRKYIWISYSLIAAIFLIFIGIGIYRIYHPQLWDFTAFYLYGKVAAAGYNFYLPENFHIVFNTLRLPFSENPGGFVDSVVNVGFPYPPPTIMYFTLLGAFSYHTALIVWTTFILIFLFGSIYLIYNMFLKEYRLKGLVLVTIIFLIFSQVITTISFSQTNFILLFLLLLMKKYSDKKFAGIFLALAIFTKPYMIVFGLFFLIRKQWKTLGYFILSSFIIVGCTMLFFGKEVFLSYIFNNPSKRLPHWVFSEDVNQSLNAVLIRLKLITIDNPVVYVYISIGLILLTAFYLFYLLKRKLYDYIWVVLLLVGLMLYPGTLSHYGVLLLFIIFQFFDEKKELGFNSYLNIPIIGIFYYLSSVSLFACICFLLIVLISKSLLAFNAKIIHPKLYKDAIYTPEK